MPDPRRMVLNVACERMSTTDSPADVVEFRMEWNEERILSSIESWEYAGERM